MKNVICIVGPTASGKTDVSVCLARDLNAEIISADSMQVYRGLNIGTAKASEKVRSEIPHHIIDIIDPTEEYSIHDFRSQALSAIDDIMRRGKLPIVVGGSGLYVRALTDGLAPHPGRDDEVRARLEEQVAAEGIAAVYAELQGIDAESAAAINPNDKRRIIRALEIYQVSGKTATAWKAETISLESLGYRVCYLGVRSDRQRLYDRVHARVDAMMAEGLLEEVRQLDRATLSKTTAQAVGYKELFAYLEGRCNLDEAVSEVKKNTRHLVKKQFTWFNKDNRIQWFDLSGDGSLVSTANEIKKVIETWLSQS